MAPGSPSQTEEDQYPGSPATATPTTTTTTPKSKDKECLTRKEFLAIDKAIRNQDFPFLQKHVKGDTELAVRRVNLSEDPLLNVMIAYDSKDGILVELINNMTPEALKAENKVGDTALHVAAAKDRENVTNALLARNHNLMYQRNKKGETPLMKAAFFGSANTFKCLLSRDTNMIYARTYHGANVLQCAIVGNNPDLALEIAQLDKSLMLNRNVQALTPLQVMVTIPEVFHSSWEWGPVESLIYAIIPLTRHNESNASEKKKDEETPEDSTQPKPWVKDNEDNAESDKESTAMSSRKFLKKCQCFAVKGVFEVRHSIIFILKKLFTRVKELEDQKIKHAQTMKLIAYLARDPGYWDFIQKGMSDQQSRKDIAERNLSFRNEIDDADAPSDSSDKIENDKILSCCLEIKNLLKEVKKKIESKMEPEIPRWHESPLIVGVKMGLHDYVEQILKARPQSAEIKDLDGRNVLQVAIKCGHIEIVKIIADMTKGPNPELPSWLLSDVKGNITDDEKKEDDEKKKDDEKKNTILHYAAGTTIKREGLALQMRHEIKWFEMVKELLPKDMVYSRNINEKTAQELFDENHAEMVKSGRNQLMEIGKTCSGLLAAVVFATSFSIPGGKDSDNSTKNNMTKTEGNHFSNESVGFKVFTHAYMMGLTSATCSLLLFLSLLTSNYSPEAFRKSLPTRCVLAGGSFLFALMALLVAFLSNAYLTIYGGGKPNAEDLLPLILELTGFPFLLAVVWFFGGFRPGFLDFIFKMFRR